MDDIPYCGPAPTPAMLATAWNLDPPVLVVLALAAPFAARRGRAAAGAWLLLAVAFVSPLCALSAALFSARAAHHVLLVAGAAPLLALALPRARPGGLGAAFAVHAAVFWAWHAPGLYAWAIVTPAAYWLMQASLLASATWLWRAALARDAEPVAALAALVGTVAHMGLLGALLVFAPLPLYAPHLATTAPFGLAPLDDQQLAGLVMWTVGLAPYLAAGLLLGWRRLAAAA